ncbi:MAG TPA: hypothetical protein VI957_03930 [Candidatus Paceibacterota bacterium]|nr:MAG: hypothetical protein A3J08_03300 [Candidatus Lloydbacteria bacterium RIFCSPLOWO2_02_FULL_51_11]
MILTVNKKQSVEIENAVVAQILNMYSEEKLIGRPIFQNAFANDSIEYKDLKDESDKILIPWQMFLLDSRNLKKELDHIEKMRADKVSSKLMAKRRGIGNVTSKRIIDRLIRLQNFITATNTLPQNAFCGSLVGKSNAEAVAHILSYFEIDINKFRGYRNKSSALSYLLGKVENKYINISQGVLTNKMLPMWQVVDNSIYKNTSGFVIKDDKIPFIFLPSEINPDEVKGRQIYTIIYLIVLIGLNEYDFFIEKNFRAKALSATNKQKKIYSVTSEVLLPSEATEKLSGSVITPSTRDDLASEYKITPTAVVVTLRIRRTITSQAEYEALLPPPYDPPKTPTHHPRSPKIETSVRKFCGKYSFEFVNAGIKSGQLSSVQSQYLLFGAVNKKNFKKYRDGLSI